MAMAKAAASFGGAPLIFAATGNSSRRAERPEWRMAASLPAAAADVVSVAAAEPDGAGYKVASFSNSMPTVIAPRGARAVRAQRRRKHRVQRDQHGLSACGGRGGALVGGDPR